MKALYRRIPPAWRPFVIASGAILLFALGGAVYLALAAQAPALFACHFARSTHLYCPGCGGSRAVYALLRLDLLGSLVANPALLVGLLTLAYYELAFLRLAHGRGRVHTWPAIAYAAFLIGHFALRNILLVACGIDPLGDLIAFWR